LGLEGSLDSNQTESNMSSLRQIIVAVPALLFLSFLSGIFVSCNLFNSNPIELDKVYDSHDSARVEIWFHPLKFWEGLAAQRVTIEELLLKSKELNAWFVEPCIQGGRLLSCGHLNRTKSHVKLRDVYDLDRLKEFYPKIVSFENFTRLTSYDEICVYFSIGKRRLMRKECLDHYGRYASLRHHEVNMEHIFRKLSKGVRKVRKGDPQKVGKGIRNVVLSLPLVEKYMFDVQDQKREDFKSKYFVFNPNHYAYVQEHILPALSVSNDQYSVIHWRAERMHISHVECAKAIVQAKELMEKDLPENHKFVLMTALRRKKMENLLWSDYRDRNVKKKPENDTEAALQLLEDNGFISLESVIDQDSDVDSSYLATWDLIVAENAKKFSTCTREGNHRKCKSKWICNACNHLGNFSTWAIDLRSYHGKNSEICWPK